MMKNIIGFQIINDMNDINIEHNPSLSLNIWSSILNSLINPVICNQVGKWDSHLMI